MKPILRQSDSGPVRAGGAHARAVKQWIREAAELDDDATILVTELACAEPGCPPYEVVMVVMRPEQPAVQRKLHCCLDAVTRAAVAAAWAAPDCETRG